jgi:hypothetical protein
VNPAYWWIAKAACGAGQGATNRQQSVRQEVTKDTAGELGKGMIPLSPCAFRQDDPPPF